MTRMVFERDPSGRGPYPGSHRCDARDCPEDAVVAFLRYAYATHRYGGGGSWTFRCKRHAAGIRDGKKFYIAQRFEAVEIEDGAES